MLFLLLLLVPAPILWLLLAMVTVRAAYCVRKTRADRKIHSLSPSKPWAGAPAAKRRRPVRTLVVLGSGGHTSEMMSLLGSLDRRVGAGLLRLN